jgi:hypothetical protein
VLRQAVRPAPRGLNGFNGSMKSVVRVALIACAVLVGANAEKLHPIVLGKT